MKRSGPIVAGVDFGTQSVRVALVSADGTVVGAAAADLVLHRGGDDPDRATQSHDDHMRALAQAMRHALRLAGVLPQPIAALALDTTGSSVIMVDGRMRPLGEYYLWCDHRAKAEAEQITALARERELPALAWCGGVYSSEWGWAKLLHWLRRQTPMQRGNLASAFEHCDYVAATLAGVVDPAQAPRSVCAMGHKWMWHPDFGGLPEEGFWRSVDPLLEGIRAKLDRAPQTSDHIAGRLAGPWAEALNLPAGIPIPVGAFDAHWDAIGAGARAGDMVNVIGTSTCMIGVTPNPTRIPGVCGVVKGSVHPSYTGVEAGLSATGDIFEAIARRAGVKVSELARGLEAYRAGQTGLLRLTWDNGDRTVLVNPELGGVTFGWNLLHTAQDELFSAIEGTAFHTRIILDRMAEHGVPVERVINAGGIPQNNSVLNQIYANVFNKPVLVPDGTPTSLGSGIFALLAAGDFKTIEEAQKNICLPYRTYTPEPKAVAVYNQLFPLYRKAYFALGQSSVRAVPLGDILPELRRIAASSRT